MHTDAPHRTDGIHHITAITADPQKNLDFYEGFLGQRLVKKTVNFDDPTAYHLYYGDAVGTPGTILTFFYWPGIPRGVRGIGEVSGIYYAIEEASFSFWKKRTKEYGIECTEETLPFGEQVLILFDPDGLRIGLVAASIESPVVPWSDGPVPRTKVLRGFYGASIAVPELALIESSLTGGLGYELLKVVGKVTRLQAAHWPGKYVAIQEKPDLPRARQGAGSVHHIAFQAKNDSAREALRQQVNAIGIASTGMIDRQYFHSTYFMTPAGVLFEIATDDIGFGIDEPISELGEHLKLPPQHEASREAIEKHLVPVVLPRHRHA